MISNKRSSRDGRPKKLKTKRSRKKEAQAAADLEEEERLAALLFGAPSTATSSAAEEKEQPLFEIDRSGKGSDDTDEEYRGEKGESNDGPAWVDEDDAGLQVNLMGTSRLRKLRKSRTEEAASALSGTDFEERLRQRFQSTTSTTARTDWATVKDDSDHVDDEGDTPEASSEPLLMSSATSSKLPSNIINMMRCPDANQSDPCQSVVQSVHFHPASDPDSPLMLTAGLDKSLRFFQVGVDKSEKVHGIHFPKLPIYSAQFLGTTGNVLVSGRRPFFYIYDAVAGKLDHVPRIVGREEKSLERFTASPDGRTVAFMGNDGYVILFDAQRKNWIADLKMSGSVRALTFTPDGQELLGSGSDGDVYRWDLGTRRCVERFSNEDGTISSYLAASSRHFAVGAESGVVNLYSEYENRASSSSSLMTHRQPIKSIMNLHTSSDMVKFNPSGEILAMSTRREKHGMKLLHVPTATVFANWPTSKTPLNYVWSMDFSPESKFLAVGNDKGQCLLYRLMHYQD